MLGPVLEALFPKRCAGCGEGRWPFCDGCRVQIVALAPPWCERCGAPSARPAASCRHCPPPPIARARAPYLFEGPLRRAVHRLKFAGWRPVASALGTAMARVWESQVWESQVWESQVWESQVSESQVSESRPEVVTWVPLSGRRLSQRGFDQARELAVVVSGRLEIPSAGLLRRASDPGPQARRGGEERRIAMQGMFEARGQAPRRVLLVDDVLTTGATAAACARALMRAGASEVGVLTAARAVAAHPSGSILGRGLASGSVVARGGVSPVVDASRGRSDPRKPTLGR